MTGTDLSLSPKKIPEADSGKLSCLGASHVFFFYLLMMKRAFFSVCHLPRLSRSAVRVGMAPFCVQTKALTWTASL